ncbi:MAG TPA: AAA family ATPase, partial [Clostridiales bacterium]|nr:AAA family ATPase [Clostridiales bacterium]
MITKRKIEQEIRINYENRNQFIEPTGELNMVKVLDKFQELMKEEYREETEKFKEKDGRIMFLAFIKPII